MGLGERPKDLFETMANTADLTGPAPCCATYVLRTAYNGTPKDIWAGAIGSGKYPIHILQSVQKKSPHASILSIFVSNRLVLDSLFFVTHRARPHRSCLNLPIRPI